MLGVALFINVYREVSCVLSRNRVVTRVQVHYTSVSVNIIIKVCPTSRMHQSVTQLNYVLFQYLFCDLKIAFFSRSEYACYN